jgi:TP901 family phage tail tape measure protein
MASPAAILQVFVNANTKVASAQLAAFEKQLHGVGKTSAGTTTGMGKFTKGAAGAATAITAAGVAIGVAGKQLYDLGKEFDSAYDTIRTRTGATGKKLDRLKRDFRGVASQVPEDFKTVGEAIGGLNQRLGLTGKPLREISTQMLNLSRLTCTDLDSNIKSVSRAFVDFEVPVKRQRRSLDGLFRLYQKSGASVDELASSVQQFGSPLRTLGFSFEEAAAMFANFERAGVNTQTMVPGLKLAIGNLVKPTDDFAKTMRQLGVDAQQPGPALKEIMDLLGPGGNLNNIEKMSLAMQVFGKRAGADMAEAIKQGRFNLDEYLKVFSKGDTINKAARDTNDFSENMRIFGNRLKVAVRPAAEAVFNAMSRLSKFLAGPEGRKGIKIIGEVFKATFAAIKFLVKPMVQTVIAGFKGIRAAVKFVRGIIGPVRQTFNTVKDAIVGAFQSAYQAVVSLVNKIIGVINAIPGIPDIGQVGGSGRARGPIGPQGSGPIGPQRRQRGGVMNGGAPSGDSIPAMLERGEYVLNREAVKKIGVKRLNKINFSHAPRFQKGGYIDTLTEFPGKFVKPLADAGTAALGLLMNGPGQFLKMLPKPNIPAPFTAVGPMVLEAARAFIKQNATSPLKDNAWVDSNTFAVANFLASKFNASISSSYRSPAQNAAVGGVPNSSHTRGTPSNPGAFDFVPPSGGMQSFAGKNIAGIVENMIHDVGSGLHNHIAFFQRGGLATRSGPNRGGWYKTGYTVFDDVMGYRGPLRGKAYAELGAPSGGVGYISRLLGINKELPLDFPLEVKIGNKKTKLYKRDIGTGQGTSAYSIDIWKSMWPFYGLNQFSKGTAYIRRADGKAGPSASEIRKNKQEKRLKKLTSKVTRAGANFPQKGKLFGNSKQIAKQQEIIDLAERNFGAEFGPGGSDYTEDELSQAIQIWTRLQKLQTQRLTLLSAAKQHLKGLRSRYEKGRNKAKGPFKKAFGKGLSAVNKSLGQVNSDLRDLVGLTGTGGKFGSGGALGDTAFRLKELGFQATGSATGDSEIASLLRDQLNISRRNLAIAQAQAPVFSQFMPKFHQGGIVQGPLGAERPIMAQAGEGVFTRDQMRAMGGNNITVVIEDGAIDSNRIRVEVDGVLQDKISTVRRSTPNRRYAVK